LPQRLKSGGILALAILLIAAFFAIPFFSALTGYRDYIFTGWSLGLLTFGLAPYYRSLTQDFGHFVTLAFFYFAASALYVGVYEFNRYQLSASEAKLYFSYSSFYFFLALLVLSQYRLHRFTLWFFPTLGVLNALYTCVGVIFGFSKLSDGYGYSGIVDYPSVNGVLTVVCYYLLLPFLSKHQKAVATVLTLLAILASKSSTPLGAFIVGAIALGCKTWKTALTAAAAGVLLLSLGYAFDHQLFNPQGRVEAWGIFMSVWSETFPLFFGSGPGTFSSLAIETQLAKNYMVGHYYLFMHNEWLQVLYETGLIGLFFVVGIFTLALYKSFKRSDHYTVAALVSYGAASLLVFPLRYFWGALLAVHLICLGFGGQTHGRQKGSWRALQ
jgi:hypothetical protein